ncbi:MAG: NAD-dependent epimerase/dehydratase family protein [Candidatus Ozemobacteraceae bacterium]
MRIFLTGATGFLGRRLFKRLLADGHEVCGLVRNPGSHIPKDGKFLEGDILSPPPLPISAGSFDLLIHLAALITFSPDRLEELHLVNGTGTERILQWAQAHHIPRTVVVSSACTCGISVSPSDILDEASALSARVARRNPYLQSKLATERAANAAAEQGMHVVTVLPTTVYGPGDDSLNSGTLIAQVTRNRVIPVPPGGSNVIDIDDLLDGLLIAAEKGVSGNRYILGGENLSFATIIDTIARVTDRSPIRLPLPLCSGPIAAATALIIGTLTKSRFLTPQIIGDLYKFKYYSSDRAHREFGWKAGKSFEATIRNAWNYYLDKGLLS